MKVILLEDIPRVGHEGEVIDVADGYLRNYLEPRNLAVRATKGALKDLENRRDAIERRDDQKRASAQEKAEELRGQRIVVRAPTGEGGRLHGTVTTGQIALAAEEQLHIVVDRRDIDIPEAIRETGDYLINARIYKDVEVQLPVRVLGIDEEERSPEEVLEEVAEQIAAEEEAVAAEEAEEAEEEVAEAEAEEQGAEEE
ncbi:MAG: 50S ribosomal protein L9 [candidate division WS1 bacterium]|jgi:large subunit ribosomal protein L9|nr:50S ribosomal protein L9 [candidate division WS1 bacterium]